MLGASLTEKCLVCSNQKELTCARVINKIPNGIISFLKFVWLKKNNDYSAGGNFCGVSNVPIEEVFNYWNVGRHKILCDHTFGLDDYGDKWY